MMPILADPRTQFELFDDFLNLDTVKWASVDDAGTGTNTANGVAGGQVSVVTAAADNDYHLMTSAAKVFKFAAGKPLWFEAEFTLTEANTDDANILLGLVSVTTSGNLQNDGAGPASSYDGAVLFKVDGTMTIQAETSAGSAQATNANVCTFTSGSTYRVGIHFDPADGVTGLVTFEVEDRTAGVLYQPAIHRIALASLGAMNLVYGVKAGGANAESLKMNYIRCIQAR